jgi:cytidylate kinase
MIIALDGPAGSGKSTIARILSQQLQIEYIDSGAIYRTLTLYGMRNNGGNCSGYETEVADYFTKNQDQFNLTYEQHTQVMWLGGEDVSQAIRDPALTKQIRYIADHKECREIVNNKMRSLADRYSFVIDGRDIGTVVFPDTPHKFFLNATVEIRATRRAKELSIPLQGRAYQQLLQDISERDRTDRNRAIAPLIKATDAFEIDTSYLSIEEVVSAIRAGIKNSALQ